MSLSTHVLDTVKGGPAEGVKIELFAVDADGKQTLIKEVKTNNDGRVDEPLFTKEETKVGKYALVFHVAEYFRGRGVELPEPAFIDEVPLHFGIADADSHYHVPLVITPWTYSTYRGS